MKAVIPFLTFLGFSYALFYAIPANDNAPASMVLTTNANPNPWELNATRGKVKVYTRHQSQFSN